MAKLRKDDVVTIHVLKDKGESNARIARVLGVTEGAVRYHLRRRERACEDGRKRRFLIEQLGLAEVAQSWWSAQLGPSPSTQLSITPFRRREISTIELLIATLTWPHGHVIGRDTIDYVERIIGSRHQITKIFSGKNQPFDQ